MSDETTVVHVTHEAVGKVGGIGAVLHGFFTSQSYLNTVERSILIGPLFTTEGPASERLGDDGEVLYSSVDGLINPQYASAFRKIGAPRSAKYGCAPPRKPKNSSKPRRFGWNFGTPPRCHLPTRPVA